MSRALGRLAAALKKTTEIGRAPVTASERKRRVEERLAKQREEIENVGGSIRGDREGGGDSEVIGEGSSVGDHERGVVGEGGDGGDGARFDEDEDDERSERDEEEDVSEDDAPTDEEEAGEEEEEDAPEVGGPKQTDVIVDFETHVASMIWKGEVV